MKVSELWLREWVNPALTTEELAAQLTMAGLEVDAVNSVAGQFSNLVVAEVLSTEAHPQADKLSICKINANDESPYIVVCGASNVRPGLKVAFAKLGATLPGGMKIKEVTLRGQVSQGMLCSSSELGLEDKSEGILELPHDAPIGEGLRDYMHLNDHVLDIDLTPNRADCFSILGVAREVAALNNLSLKDISTAQIMPDVDESLAIKVEDPDACGQYYGRIIRNINPDANTPLWLKERLRRGGIRPLHPVVDITNYVMLELGQPMHAYDKTQLDGEIQVRYARLGETVELLDGQDVALSEKVLIIADNSKPLAIAGIMGGNTSAVQADTTDIFLESAYFNPINIAGIARKYSLFTDSSQRFERGVDPALQAIAIERATELLLQIVGGQAGPLSQYSNEKHLPAEIEILFNPARVEKMVGIQIAAKEMEVILENIGMTINTTENIWRVNVPSHRFDIKLEVDLIEEIARLNGYDKIIAQPMVANVIPGATNPYEQLILKMSQFLSHRGYHETISYSFVDPYLQQAIYPESKTLDLLNPISQELSQMRTGMWPGLIASMIYNIHRQQTGIKLFEAGVVFNTVNDEVVENTSLAGLIVGERGMLNWAEDNRTFDFFDLKGDLEALFNHLNRDEIQFIAEAHPALHPGKSARIKIAEEYAGWIGVLHPQIADELDLNSEVVLFEIALDPLLNQKNRTRYQKISKYPQIRRDLSLLVNSDITVAEIEKVVREIIDTPWLKSFNVFDIYRGDEIPEGKKSVAIALTLQDDNRTLVDSEINTIINAIIKTLDEKFSIILRD